MRVQVFGCAEVADDGGRIALTPLQLMLVTLVYGHGPGGVGRPRAVELLWGTSVEDRSRQRLRQLLYDLRTRVDCPVIDTPADALRPRPDVACDLTTFDRALTEGPVRDAARLVAEGFIRTDFEVPEPFDEWRRGKAKRLLREVKTRALAQWRAASGQGRSSEAHDAAEALYAIDPHDPQIIGRVIESRAREGNLTGAEEAFARYLTALPDGSEPHEEVTRTIERVRTLDDVHDHRDEVGAPETLFVGRRDALLLSRGAIDSVAKGSFELVLISGESGIGKTRLLDEVHKDAVLRGLRCLRAQPVELERNIPLNPLLDALCDVDLTPHLTALGRPWSSVVESLLPHGMLNRPAEEPPPIRPSSLSRRLLESFSLLLERLAREKPTLLIIDDLQWADVTTVTALQFLQRRWSYGALGIFATVRPELVHPDDPVSKYLTATAGLEVKHIELPILALAEAVELVDAVSGGDIDAAKAARLSEIAGCHPLYLAELTRDYLGGRLTLPERPSDEVAIPTSLAQMLDARLEAMDDRSMRVAGVLAVAGKPLRLPEIAALADLDLRVTTAAVDTLTRARFAHAERDSVRIAHELFRSAVYRHLSGPQRALHHRAIAERLSSGSEVLEHEQAGELAIHYSRAGEHELAARHGWIAATRALEAGAVAEAAHLFEIVVQSEGDPARRADATAELAKALHVSRDITRANPQLRLAAEQLRSTGRPEAARRLDIKRVEGLAEVAAAPISELLHELRRIKAAARETSDWECVALALDAELHLLHRGGQVEGIPALFDEMEALVPKGPPEAQLLSYTGLALGVFFRDPAQAQSAAERAVRMARKYDRYRLRALNRLLIVLQARGLITQPSAAKVIAEAREAAERSGDVLLRFSIESNLAVAHLDAGDVDRAEALMSNVPNADTAAEMNMNRFVQANNEAELALARQDYESAAEAFSRAASYLGLTTPTYMRDIVNAGLGLCALQTGNLREAREREGLLQDTDRQWYFDPTTILAFRAKLLEVRNRQDEAVHMLTRAMNDLEGRLPLAWLKVALLLTRLQARYTPNSARYLAGRMAEAARDMALTYRAEEFEALRTRLT